MWWWRNVQRILLSKFCNAGPSVANIYIYKALAQLTLDIMCQARSLYAIFSVRIRTEQFARLVTRSMALVGSHQPRPPGQSTHRMEVVLMIQPTSGVWVTVPMAALLNVVVETPRSLLLSEVSRTVFVFFFFGMRAWGSKPSTIFDLNLYCNGLRKGR